MNTEEQFLHLIRADLDNPVPRLVYADWLDELGDERGEFIRVQCELERPGLSALKQRWLRERERELLEEYKADWLSPAAALNLKTADWTFRRGFVEEVTIGAAEFIEQGNFLHRAFPLLCGLVLRNTEDRLISAIANCEALGKINRLLLTSDFVESPEPDEWNDDVAPRALSRIQWFLRSPHFVNLRHLSLADGVFDNRDIQEIFGCGNLRLHSLDLSHNHIVPRGMRLGLDTFQLLAAASCVKELRELALRSMGLSINHVLILSYSDNLANLEKLDLGGNRLGSQSHMISLVRLERFSKLKRLHLSSCGVGDWGIRALEQTPLWHQLESLQLANNEITDRGMIALAESEPPAKLRSLELQRNAIGDAGLMALAGSPVLAAFSEIHLEHNDIKDPGASALARSDFAQNLSELHLRGNLSLSDRGGMALASAGFPSLRVLDLAGTHVGDDTAMAIAESSASDQLRILDLGRTRIGERGAMALAASPFLNSLEFLDLRMNQLPEGCVSALQERFGNLVLL